MRGIVLELFSIGGLIAGIHPRQLELPAPRLPAGALLNRAFNDSEQLPQRTCFPGYCHRSHVAGPPRRQADPQHRPHHRSWPVRPPSRSALRVRPGLPAGRRHPHGIHAFLPHSTQIANSRLIPYFLAGVHAVSFVVPAGLQQQLLNGIAELKHNAPDWIKLHP